MAMSANTGAKIKKKVESKDDELLMKIDAEQFETRDSEVLKCSLP